MKRFSSALCLADKQKQQEAVADEATQQQAHQITVSQQKTNRLDPNRLSQQQQQQQCKSATKSAGKSKTVAGTADKLQLAPEDPMILARQRRPSVSKGSVNVDQQALFSAVECNQTERAKTILDDGKVNVNSLNGDKLTCLDIAVLLRNVEMVRLLQQYNAKESSASRRLVEDLSRSLKVIAPSSQQLCSSNQAPAASLQEAEHGLAPQTSTALPLTASSTGQAHTSGQLMLNTGSLLSSALFEVEASFKQQQSLWSDNQQDPKQQNLAVFNQLLAQQLMLLSHQQRLGQQARLGYVGPPGNCNVQSGAGEQQAALQQQQQQPRAHNCPLIKLTQNNSTDSACDSMNATQPYLSGAAISDSGVTNAGDPVDLDHCPSIAYRLMTATSQHGRALGRTQRQLAGQSICRDSSGNRSDRCSVKGDRIIITKYKDGNKRRKYDEEVFRKFTKLILLNKHILDDYQSAVGGPKQLQQSISADSTMTTTTPTTTTTACDQPAQVDKLVVTNDDRLPIIEVLNDLVSPGALMSDFYWLLKINGTQWMDIKRIRQQLQKSHSSSNAPFAHQTIERN
ncbi:hypothetical protein SUGI_1488620 [Cryptomeria japonica]|uniref:Uncharacterized protein n=1 Tax=Cryptomeria japonica TaxID=3369 RepID=A0AAD3RRK7_CRYJA|nr:hypothetical protein SUGI_1488620 [Cryptomeria japonica]